MSLVHYRYAKPDRFTYIIPESQLNMYVKVKTGPGESSNVILKTPEVTVSSGIEETVEQGKTGKKKYKLQFDLTNLDPKFIEFMQKLEENVSIKGREFENYTFRSAINFEQQNSFFSVKVPYRYRKFELSVIDSSGHMTSVYHLLRKPFQAELTLELTNIWKIGKAFGPLWQLKMIKLTRQTFDYIN